MDPRVYDCGPDVDTWDFAVLMLAAFAFGLGIGWWVWA